MAYVMNRARDRSKSPDKELSKSDLKADTKRGNASWVNPSPFKDSRSFLLTPAVS